MSRLDVICRPRAPGFVRLERLLDTTTMPEESRWHGKLRGSRGSCRAFSCELTLSLRLFRGVVVGQALGLDFPHGSESRDFEVVGSTNGVQIGFDLQSNASFLFRTPFECTGTLSDRGTRILGTFSLACFLAACGCQGGSGNFHFRKIVRGGLQRNRE